MNDKLQKLLELLEQDEELKQKYYDNPPKTNEEFIAAAKELGVELTEDDLELPTVELSMEDLDQVAGGEKGPDKDCGSGAEFACTIFFGAAWYTENN